MATLLKIGTDMFLNKGFEYVYGGSGGDKNMNGIPDIDCSHLIQTVLRAGGYSIPYMTTSELNSTFAEKYFEIVPLNQGSPQQNDLILYESHVGIFISFLK
jgi:cell wall-associated NlpC family hydrolase